MVICRDKKLFGKISNLLLNKTIKGASYLFISQIIAMGLEFSINILYSRLPNFYILSQYFLIVTFIRTAFDFGLKNVFINSYGKYKTTTNVEKKKYLFSFLRIRLVTALIFVVAGFLCKFFVLPIFSTNTELINIIFLSFIGGVTASLLDSCLTIFIVQQKFNFSAIFMIIAYGVKIGLVLIIYFLFKINVYTIITLYIFIPLIFSILIYIFMNKKDDVFVSTQKIHYLKKEIWQFFKDLFNSGKWLILTMIIFSLFDSSLSFFAIKYSNPEQISALYLATSFKFIFIIIGSSLTLANLAEINNFKKMKQYYANLKRNYIILFGILVILSIVIIFSRPFMLFFFPEQPLLSNFFKLLSIAYLLQMLGTPILSFLIPLKKLYYETLVKLIGLVSLFCILLLFFKSIGIINAIIVYDIITILIYGVTSIIILRLLKNLQ